MMLYCDFCEKSQNEVKRLIKAKGGTCICNECVVLCLEVLIDEVGEVGEVKDTKNDKSNEKEKKHEPIPPKMYRR